MTALLACSNCGFTGTLDDYDSAGFDDNTGAFVICPKCYTWRSTAWARGTTEESEVERPRQHSLFNDEA